MRGWKRGWIREILAGDRHDRRLRRVPGHEAARPVELVAARARAPRALAAAVRRAGRFVPPARNRGRSTARDRTHSRAVPGRTLIRRGRVPATAWTFEMRRSRSSSTCALTRYAGCPTTSFSVGPAARCRWNCSSGPRAPFGAGPVSRSAQRATRHPRARPRRSSSADTCSGHDFVRVAQVELECREVVPQMVDRERARNRHHDRRAA